MREVFSPFTQPISVVNVKWCSDHFVFINCFFLPASKLAAYRSYYEDSCLSFLGVYFTVGRKASGEMLNHVISVTFHSSEIIVGEGMRVTSQFD